MSSSIQMVRADKHPLRPPVLPPLCEPLPPHKVGGGGGFLHLCTLSSVVVHANIMQKNRGKNGGRHIRMHTHTCIGSCVSHLPSVEHVVILCSALSHEM